MSYADYLPRIQKDTVRNLTESLQEWEDKLRECTQRLHVIKRQQLTSIEEYNTAVEELEIFRLDVDAIIEELEDYNHDTNILLDTLEEKQATDLRDNYFETFFKEWYDLKASIELHLTRLKENLAKFESDNESMKRWAQKSKVTEELLKIISDVMKFHETPATLINYDGYLVKFNDLEAKVISHIDIIDSNLVAIKDIYENQLIVSENREKVQMDKRSIISKKINLLEKLKEAKNTVISVAKQKQTQDDNEQNLRKEIERWQKILDDNNDTLEGSDSNRLGALDDNHKAIEILEKLLTDIETHWENLNTFKTSAFEVVEMLNSTSSAELVRLLRNFFKNWNFCQSRAFERLNDLQLFEKNEKRRMAEWKEKVAKTVKLLDDNIAESRIYCELPKQSTDLPKYLTQYQEMLDKVNSHNTFVKGHKKHGNQLVENHQVKKQADKDVVISDLGHISQKEDLVQNNLATARIIYNILNNRQTVHDGTARNIDECLQNWQIVLHKYTNQLDEINISYKERENDIEKTIDLLSTLSSSLENYQDRLDAFKEDTGILIEHLYGKHAEKASTTCQLFFEDWTSIKDDTTEKTGIMVQLKENETTLMGVWKEKAADTMTCLDEALTDIQPYCSLPHHSIDVQSHLKQQQEMINKIDPQLEFIKDQINFGQRLLEEYQVTMNVNRNVVNADVADLSHKDYVLETDISTSHTLYNILHDRQIVCDGTARNIDESVGEWQLHLEVYTDMLNDIDTAYEKKENDMQKTIDLFTALLSHVKKHQKKLNTFKADTALLIEYLNAKQAWEASASCQMFFKNWNQCQSDVQERLNGFRKQLVSYAQNEPNVMADWREKMINCIKRLDEIIAETNTYCDLPSQSLDLQDYLLQYNEVLNNVNIQLEFVKDQKEHARELLRTLQVQTQSNKEVVLANIAEISEKEELLQSNLSTAQTRFVILRLRLTLQEDTVRNINESIDEWQLVLDKFTDKLDDIENSYEMGETSTQNTMDLLKKLFSDRTAGQGIMDKFIEHTVLLIETLNTEQAGKANIKCQYFLENWNLNWNNINEAIHAMDNQLHNELTVKMVLEWQVSSKFINNWLAKAERDLEPHIKAGNDMHHETTEMEDEFHLVEEQYLISEAIPKDLVINLEEEGKEVDRQIEHYSKMLTEETHRELEDVIRYQERKTTLDKKLTNAAILLEHAEEDAAGVDSVKQWLNSWCDVLHKRERSLEEIEVSLKKEESLINLTELIEEEGDNSLEVEQLVVTSTQLLDRSQFHKKSTATLKDDLAHFHKEWKRLHQRLLDATICLENEIEDSHEVEQLKNKSVITEEVFGEDAETCVESEAPQELQLQLQLQLPEENAPVTKELPNDEEDENVESDSSVEPISLVEDDVLDSAEDDLLDSVEEFDSDQDKPVDLNQEKFLVAEEVLSLEYEMNANSEAPEDATHKEKAPVMEEILDVEEEMKINAAIPLVISHTNDTQMILEDMLNFRAGINVEAEMEGLDDCLSRFDGLELKVRENTSVIDKCIDIITESCDTESQDNMDDIDDQFTELEKSFRRHSKASESSITFEEITFVESEVFDPVILPENDEQATNEFVEFQRSLSRGSSQYESEFQGSLSRRSSQYESNEDELMEEWTTSVIKTTAWLMDVEKECTTYSVLPEDHFDIQSFLVEFEDFVETVHTDLKEIKEQKNNGLELVNKLSEQMNKDEVNNNLDVIEEEEEKLLQTLSGTQKQVENHIVGTVLKHVDAFRAWLPTVEKRSKEGDDIGPDFDAVAEQIIEMELIQAQTVEMSFTGLLDPYNSKGIVEYFAEEQMADINSAIDEWISINSWVDNRLDRLVLAKNCWNEFNARKLELVEYLRDVEQELKGVIGIDLNNKETVRIRSSGCQSVSRAMDAHKDHVTRLIDTAKRLTNLLTTNTHRKSDSDSLPDSIRCQVDDILKSWDTLVKVSVEFRTTLEACATKFEWCNSVYQDVREWIDDCTQLFSQFTIETSSEIIDILTVRLVTKQNEEDFYRQKLYSLIALDEELSQEELLCPNYTLPGDIDTLSWDFRDTIEKLDKLKIICGLWRHTNLTRSYTPSWEGSPAPSTAPAAPAS